MPKIPECDRCQYFLHSPYIVCAVNPFGPASLTCEDFSAIAQADAEISRHPLGGGYYLGDWVPHPFPAIVTDTQVALLDWHPQFTGHCPECKRPIAESDKGHWKCNHCDWKYAVANTPD
ncbi:MAG: hypothetical protein DCF15_15295 [Phormidesmis priestleyi]|uniref:Uncharacterized protein n=1 Tax=Phormidesmis priestleyi TaxID=268141 RepID=A0A2W4X262_9CYAN|nr:MAG: hypothetical protein DCF15_15295 [Phormidesmis priestleyi]